jgi:hypothetical protein
MAPHSASLKPETLELIMCQFTIRAPDVAGRSCPFGNLERRTRAGLLAPTVPLAICASMGAQEIKP